MAPLIPIILKIADAIIDFGFASQPTLDAIARIIDRPPKDPETGGAVTPEHLIEQVNRAYARAQAPFQDVRQTAQAEIAKVDAKKG